MKFQYPSLKHSSNIKSNCFKRFRINHLSTVLELQINCIAACGNFCKFVSILLSNLDGILLDDHWNLWYTVLFYALSSTCCFFLFIPGRTVIGTASRLCSWQRSRHLFQKTFRTLPPTVWAEKLAARYSFMISVRTVLFFEFTYILKKRLKGKL